MAFDVNIVHTGSKGNCVIIDKKIMIDVGRSYRELEPLLSDMEVIFVTHRHGDHLNPAVINQMTKKMPWKVNGNLYMNKDVLEKVKSHKNLTNLIFPSDHIIDSNTTLNLVIDNKKYSFCTFNLYHDVPNQGFVITNELGEKLIYATDTSSLQDAPNEKYDYILIEGNYDEDKLADDMDIDVNLLRLIRDEIINDNLPSLSNVELSIDLIDDLYEDNIEITDEEIELIDKLMKKAASLVDRAERNTRHLSVQQFENFVLKHMNPNATIYQLHESEGFGLRSDLGSEF
jgi:phosphoribosyl 1,2-cyclic phosphodiesterase